MSEITCTWSITNMEHLVSDGGVIVVNWSCTAAGGGKSAFYGGATKFEPDPSAPGYVPYADLTEEMVLGWVFAALGDEKEVIEAERIAKVEKQLHPVVESGLPWSN